MLAVYRPDGPGKAERMSTLTETFGEPISVYTREQAIEDGVLVDVTEWARETGINGPTVITAALWHLVDIDSKPRPCPTQSTRGRAHDVLSLAAFALRGALAARREPDVFYRCRLGRVTPQLRAVAAGDGVTIGLPEDF